MQTRTGFAHIPCHQSQRNKTAAVVGAVDVLRNTHAPENHPRLAVCKGTGSGAQFLGRDAADIFHRFWGELRQMRFFGLPVFGELVDIGLIVQSLFHDHMHDCV